MVFILGSVLLGFAAIAVQELPDGPGKALVSTRCTACHDLDTAIRPRLDRAEWTGVVAKMIQNGASLDETERETAIDYLSVHFGAPPRIDPAVEKVARKHIEGICSSCHDADLIVETRATEAEWLTIVTNMNAKGAGLSEADVELLAEYLARVYPSN